jgi:hypothetical protein
MISGGDIVLKMDFDSVTLTCCTLDPGNSDEAENPSGIFARSVDGRDLIPSRLWVEGQVNHLVVDRCILSSIRTRGSRGEIGTLTITDSILQAIRTSGFGVFSARDFKDSTRLASRLSDAGKTASQSLDLLSRYLHTRLTQATKDMLDSYDGDAAPPPALIASLVQDLNDVLAGPSIYAPDRFALVPLTSATMQLIARKPQGDELVRLNRMLLEEAYPIELADLTLAMYGGLASLNRCTLLGPGYVHRLEASECILDGVVRVEDTQHGCVRFCAWAAGSALPRQYKSVRVAPDSPLFTSRSFGRPGYAQLLPSADNSIIVDDNTLSAATGVSISAGAEAGSEIGAFARDKNTVKERSLLIKYQEYMPLGLDPVIVYAT